MGSECTWCVCVCVCVCVCLCACMRACSPPQWCHLSPAVFYHRWYHRLEQLWWRRIASGPEMDDSFTTKPKIQADQFNSYTQFIDEVCVYLHVYLSTHTHVCYLYEGAECAVCGVVCDEESHVLVAQFHWSWTVHGGQCDLWHPRITSDLYVWAVISSTSGRNVLNITKQFTRFSVFGDLFKLLMHFLIKEKEFHHMKLGEIPMRSWRALTSYPKVKMCFTLRVRLQHIFDTNRPFSQRWHVTCQNVLAGEAQVEKIKLMTAEFHLAASVSGSCSCASWLTVMTYWENVMLLVTPVPFLLWHVKMSAVEKKAVFSATCPHTTSLTPLGWITATFWYVFKCNQTCYCLKTSQYSSQGHIFTVLSQYRVKTSKSNNGTIVFKEQCNAAVKGPTPSQMFSLICLIRRRLKTVWLGTECTWLTPHSPVNGGQLTLLSNGTLSFGLI